MINTEICVIGGGPAGSVAALRLAQLGHQVTLIERSEFPRRHVGESLTPGILPLLETIGLRQPIEDANFLRPDSAIIRWTSDLPGPKESMAERGFQVDRGIFDQLLLTAAAAADVRVLQPAQVIRPVHAGQNDWQLDVRSEAAAYKLKARFIVDATGRRSLLPSRRKRLGEPTLALYGYWRGTEIRGTETRVDVGREQWYWGAPLPDRSFNATVFVDLKRIAGLKHQRLELFYRELLNESKLLRRCLRGELEHPVRACDATSFSVDDSIGQDWLKVGEASFAIDPSSSQGVQSAILTAIQGAVVAHTILTPGKDRLAARCFYEQRQQESVERHGRWAAGFYDAQRIFPDQSFWRRRGKHSFDPESPMPLPAKNARPRALTEQTLVRLSKSVSFADEPVIQGDFVGKVPVLTHPGLDRPVAYLHDVSVAKLLEGIDAGVTLQTLQANWSAHLPIDASQQIVQWLVDRNILVPVEDVRYVPDSL